MSEKKLNGTVIVTYRCNARCSMCNRYKAPSKPDEEISIATIKKLPKMYFTNITGGEPFIRTDLKDIVRELYKKSDRIVISTNGFFTDRIVDLAKEFPQYKKISTQNKINFIDGIMTDMSECLVYGLYVLFNSTIYDKYYRILNGSTQVNSTEINAMPVPDLDIIQEMGRKIIKSKDYSVTSCNLILEAYCG